MQNKEEFLIGYDCNIWHAYGIKEAISVECSLRANCHCLVCGMSGSGKSYATLWHLSNFYKAYQGRCKMYFLDYKCEDSYSFMRNCSRYFSYKETINALEEVYQIMQARQAGTDTERYPIILFWDEYVSNILAIRQYDKKQAEQVMNKVSEMLMLGRSLGIRLYIAVQRPDAVVFPMGSRMNYGIIILLGAPLDSLYEMMLPKEYIERLVERKFNRGEGVVLLQGSKLEYIKIPTVRDEESMHNICLEALTK